MEKTTGVFGIPVPSTDQAFLTFVVVHILISLVAVIFGLFAMLTDKGKGRHRYFGKAYFWAMLSSFCTVAILSIMSWPHNNWLAKYRMLNWTRFHTICMGTSYILLMTGFYVDNGKSLPFWKLFPQWFFWFSPR